MHDVLSGLEGVPARYVLRIGDDRHILRDAVLEKDRTPVRGPTRRGNVYLEADDPFRIVASIDSAVADSLSDTMLGPNTEFGGLLIEVSYENRQLLISGSLLSTIQRSGTAILRIAVVGVIQNDTNT